VRRRIRLLLIVLAVLLFVAVSALLTRALSIDGAERAAIAQLVSDEARGDTRAMVGVLSGCGQSPSCRSNAAQRAAGLRHPGKVLIVQVNASAGFSLTGTLGTARVVWRAGGELPVVQCVRVRRAGNVISGLHVQLLAISRRIQSGADCPGAGGGI
jgi:hypothetical protein